MVALETELVKRILIEFGGSPGLKLWRHNVGAAKDKRGALIRFGMAGQPDIMGVLGPHGRFVAIECKSPTGRIGPAQANWRAAFEPLGILYILARSVDDVRRALP